MKHLKLKKLNPKGFAHWILPAIVLVIIGGIGSYLLTASHADATFTSFSCQHQLGRKWVNNTCAQSCWSNIGAGNLASHNPYNYCNGAASPLSSSQCSSLHRVFAMGVCLKKWGANGNSMDPNPCSPSTYKYQVANPYDRCVASATAPKPVSPPPAPSTPLTEGHCTLAAVMADTGMGEYVTQCINDTNRHYLDNSTYAQNSSPNSIRLGKLTRVYVANGVRLKVCADISFSPDYCVNLSTGYNSPQWLSNDYHQGLNGDQGTYIQGY